MLTKPVLIALLAACGVHSTPTPVPAQPDGPGDVEPPEGDEPAEEQYFCCGSVTFDGKEKTGHGDGCVTIDKVQIALCNKWLYCPGGATFDEGVVDCPL